MSGWTQRCSSSGISNVCRGVPRSSARRNWSGSGSSSIRRCCVRQKYRYRKNVGFPPVFDAFTVRWTICVSGYFNLVRLSTCFFDTDASFRLLYRYLHTIGPKNIRTFRAFNCICNFLFQKGSSCLQRIERLIAFLSNTEFCLWMIQLNVKSVKYIFGIKCESIYTRNLFFIYYY